MSAPTPLSSSSDGLIAATSGSMSVSSSSISVASAAWRRARDRSAAFAARRWQARAAPYAPVPPIAAISSTPNVTAQASNAAQPRESAGSCAQPSTRPVISITAAAGVSPCVSTPTATSIWSRPLSRAMVPAGTGSYEVTTLHTVSARQPRSASTDRSPTRPSASQSLSQDERHGAPTTIITVHRRGGRGRRPRR